MLTKLAHAQKAQFQCCIILQCIAAVLASVVTTTTSFKPAMQRVSASLSGSSAEQPADGADEPSAEQPGFTITIVSAITGVHMMCAANVRPELKIEDLKRLLPDYAVDPSTVVAATRMRLFGDSSEELQDNEAVVPRNHQSRKITLKAVIDPRLCACGNQPDADSVSMCDYCHFAVCDLCLYDYGERFCGHCDKFCCYHCLPGIAQGWGFCAHNCSEWLCPECIAGNTPCKYFLTADGLLGSR